MARRPKRGRAKPFAVGEIRGRAIRGPKDGRWYWRAEIHRERATVWTGWASRNEAIAIVSSIRQDGLPEPKVATRASLSSIRTIEDLLDVWLGAQLDRQDLNERSVTVYRQAVDRIRAVVGFVLIESYMRKTSELLRNTMLRKYAPRTVELDLQRLKMAWDWGRAIGLVPVRDFPTVPVNLPKQRRFTPTVDQVERVLEHIQVPWRRVALRIQYATGARIGDIGHLMWSDVDLVEGVIHFRVTKGNQPRWVPIGKGLVLHLLRWRESQAEARREELLGVTYNTCRVGMQRELKRACEAAKVPVFTSHALRRLVVDQMARAGVDPATAAMVTGHTPTTMMRFYRQPSTADMRAAVLRARLGVLEEGEVIDFEAAVGARSAHTIKRTTGKEPDEDG